MSRKRQALDPNSPTVRGLGLGALFRDLDDQRRSQQTTPPKKMKELKARLQRDGEQWRDKHKKEFKNGNVKIFHPSPRTVADILEKYLYY